MGLGADMAFANLSNARRQDRSRGLAFPVYYRAEGRRIGITYRDTLIPHGF
jgi:hypothetical protein